jgi:predicted Zn-dependent peptidase
MAGGDFTLQRLGRDLSLYLHADERFKTTRVDLFLSTLLRRGAHTRLALIGRLLERGTRRLPNLQRLNTFLDELFGANFSVEVEALGDHQLLHLGLEVVASRFLPKGEDVLVPGLAFLGEVLADPETEGGGFRRDYLRQEKQALAAYIRSLNNDKSAYAHRRCLELMCGDDPCGLPAHGDPADFRGITARRLLNSHRQLLATAPMAVFISGQPAPGIGKRLEHDLVSWERRPEGKAHPPPVPCPPLAGPRELFEPHEVSQGRLVLGYRTGISMADADYPALLLCNALLGGDAQSLLFRQVRESAGLCYHIGSQLESLCGLLFIEAGIEPRAYPQVRVEIDRQLAALQQSGFSANDLAVCRILLQRNLWAMDDNAEGLVRFHYQQSLAGIGLSRPEWHQRLESVQAADVARVAGRFQLDTAFFLYPEQGGWRP